MHRLYPISNKNDSKRLEVFFLFVCFFPPLVNQRGVFNFWAYIDGLLFSTVTSALPCKDVRLGGQDLFNEPEPIKEKDTFVACTSLVTAVVFKVTD